MTKRLPDAHQTISWLAGGHAALMMVEEADDDAALGFVSPQSDTGFGRGAAERQRPVLTRCVCY